MKKILIVNGSKRRKGNSYALESRIVEQLQGKAEVTTFTRLSLRRWSRF